MLQLGMRFHHFGLAVRSDKHTLGYLKALGYEIGSLVYDCEQNVCLRLCRHEFEPDLELILPGKGEGPLTPILKRFDELVYHICYEVNDLDAVLHGFETADIRLVPVALPKPAILFDGRNVSFYKVKGFGIIELLEA